MPRFFFDVADRVFVADETGQDLPTLEAVEEVAAVAACDIGRDWLRPRDCPALEIQVRDESGQRVLTLRLTITVS